MLLLRIKNIVKEYWRLLTRVIHCWTSKEMVINLKPNNEKLHAYLKRQSGQGTKSQMQYRWVLTENFQQSEIKMTHWYCIGLSDLGNSVIAVNGDEKVDLETLNFARKPPGRHLLKLKQFFKVHIVRHNLPYL